MHNNDQVANNNKITNLYAVLYYFAQTEHYLLLLINSCNNNNNDIFKVITCVLDCLFLDVTYWINLLSSTNYSILLKDSTMLPFIIKFHEVSAPEFICLKQAKLIINFQKRLICEHFISSENCFKIKKLLDIMASNITIINFFFRYFEPHLLPKQKYHAWNYYSFSSFHYIVLILTHYQKNYIKKKLRISLILIKLCWTIRTTNEKNLPLFFSCAYNV